MRHEPDIIERLYAEFGDALDYHKRHITEEEFSELNALHKFVEQAREAGAA